MLRYEKKIREIIASNINVSACVDEYDITDDLRNMGMDSISFIAIVVDIEDAFGITFPDDKLFISEASTILLINQIVESNINDKKFFSSQTI